MEFNSEINHILPGVVTLITRDGPCSALTVESMNIDDSDSIKVENWSHNLNTSKHNKTKMWWINQQKLAEIINEMGRASSRAQNLQKTITTAQKLICSDQKLYVMKNSDLESKLETVIGMLKVGIKRLFLCDDTGAHNEVDPLCILDFYVHETKQRQGFGHALFNYMLKVEEVVPEQLAIDRPSPKFTSFLQKHYGLQEVITQANNFVIFPGFFNNRQIIRPPIFLYHGKGKMNNSPSHHGSASQSAARVYLPNEIKALRDYQVPSAGHRMQKNRSLSTSAGSCLQWIESRELTPQYSRFNRQRGASLPQSSVSKSPSSLESPCSRFNNFDFEQSGNGKNLFLPKDNLQGSQFKTNGTRESRDM